MIGRRDLVRSLVGAGLAAAVLPARDYAQKGASMGPADGTLVTSKVPRSSGVGEAASYTAGAVLSFAVDLYGELARQPGNLVCSPYSVAVALAMTMAGAVRRTAAEIRQVLHVDDPRRYDGGLGALTAAVDGLAGTVRRGDGSSAELVLDTASSLWGQQGLHWEEQFLDVLARDFGAGMRQVDFVAAFEPARRLVNTWTADQTQGRIDEILPAGTLTRYTRLVLVNAIYLKAPWEKPFLEHATSLLPFTMPGGAVAEVETMSGSVDSAWYATSDRWTAVSLPYAGGTLAMTLLLPAVALSPDDVAPDLPDAMAALTRGAVLIRLPRWTCRLTVPLTEPLASMGMPTAFTDAADFSGMTHDQDLAISSVQHGAFIAVDEHGTEAAAATAVTVVGVSAMLDRLTVSFDRPFLFAVHDLAHGTPLFLGRVDDPRS
jgi:serpin B